MESRTPINGETIQRLAAHAASSALNLLQHQYEDFAHYPYNQRLHAAHENFVGIFPVMKRLVYYLLIGSFLLMTSTVTYGLFYLAVMPAHAATAPLYFDYSCREHTDEKCSNQAPSECANSCSPTAIVDIFAKHTGWDAFHPEVIPEARTQSRFLTPRTHYFLEVVLQLPETTINQQIGMFTIEVELRSKSNEILAKSLRASRLPHESQWIVIVRKFLCLGPLLIGAMSESRKVVIPSFRYYVESVNHPLQHLVIRLLSQGSIWHTHRPTEVTSGEIRIGKELNRFQNTLKDWFWTCFIVGTLLIFTIQSLFACAAHILLSMWRELILQKQQGEVADDVDLGDSPYFFDPTPPQSDNVENMNDDDGQWEQMPEDRHETDPFTVEEPDLRLEESNE